MAIAYFSRIAWPSPSLTKDLILDGLEPYRLQHEDTSHNSLVSLTGLFIGLCDQAFSDKRARPTTRWSSASGTDRHTVSQLLRVKEYPRNADEEFQHASGYYCRYERWAEYCQRKLALSWEERSDQNPHRRNWRIGSNCQPDTYKTRWPITRGFYLRDAFFRSELQPGARTCWFIQCISGPPIRSWICFQPEVPKIFE